MLDSSYGYERDAISTTLGDFRGTAGVPPEEREVLPATLEDFRRHHLDFVDAYLFRHAQASGKHRICTFDETHFRRLGAELEPL
ncbi:MAG: hypothetical protein M0Z27_10665 [Thermaerobacter sp.]|nr:hypothetical protein [Thermaerobacter sp.]